MKDMNSENGSNKPKRKRKASKIQAPLPPSMEEESAATQLISNLINSSIEKYNDIVEREAKEARDDFESLQPLISEYVDDFILIGHTLDGQRVVMRYAPTPADLDKLTELCKKVLVKMMIQESKGE